MNRDETVALFLECEAKRAEARAAALADGKSEDDARNIAHEAAKAHWNAWVELLLAERKAMENAGTWKSSRAYTGAPEEGENPQTQAWLEKAAADFSRCLFLVRGVEGTVEGTKETAGEDSKEDGSAKPPVKSIQLEGDRADFSGFVFPGPAYFQSTTFSSPAYFQSATFSSNAWFRSATFSSTAYFRSATFSGRADFESATFSGRADFQSATFSGDADFRSATFSGDADFESATFSRYADFESATFSRYADFESATFSGRADFESATFSRYADFRSATFSGNADFHGQKFTNDVFFNGATFEGRADFALATFERVAQFNGARFLSEADFNAVWGRRTFSLADARFEVVPDFIQAHFEEAPRLDNVEAGWKQPELQALDEEESEEATRRGRWHRRRLEANGRYRRVFAADRSIPARWRALKRLAMQGQDTDRELEFHARELRSQRFAGDGPAPWPVLSGRAWGGFFRFWSGLAYGLFSDYGRSLARPFIASLLALIAAGAFYLSQTEAMQARLGLREASYLGGTVRTALHAPANPVPCYTPPPAPAERWRKHWPWLRRGAKLAPAPASSGSRIDGLIEPFRGQTNARAEALHLAVRNASVVLGGSGGAAHRTFGCLYGVELYGGSTPMAIVPDVVSTVSAAQKLFSAVMIFLFGLALRNMLKMK